ncbi:hypothetical protein D9758_007645 [Tetrapyrgos nigripes]|uniref:Cytochrome P450 n=1 Tax=Tetrapyrgos nigripes TaxID=182062 RepID=A0A8H5G7X8_9AGAR|nr:hypothetical protein D9758_007645 [Tetrapyrgos nigripes]
MVMEVMTGQEWEIANRRSRTDAGSASSQMAYVLIEELLEAQQNYADISYDQLVSLPYLDAVCRETLRLFSPAPSVLRQQVQNPLLSSDDISIQGVPVYSATQDTVLPLSAPIKGVDGTSLLVRIWELPSIERITCIYCQRIRVHGISYIVTTNRYVQVKIV